VRLEGKTLDGLTLETDGRLRPTNFPGESSSGVGSGAVAAYTPSGLRVRIRMGTPVQVRYGLTNVHPPGRPRLPLQLSTGDVAVQAELVRLPDYNRLFDNVRILRSTAVTCELVIASHAGSATDLEQAVDDVSFLLSIAQGCRVQWVYREERDQRGLLSREHYTRKTQPYSPLSVIDLLTPRGPREFVEATYPTYVRRRDSWGLATGLIDAYLEAKSEADYLETRGAKLAVALEALKHRYLRSGEASVSELLLDADRFRDVLPEIQAAVRQTLIRNNVHADTAKSITGKLQGLNRESFPHILKCLAEDLQLQVTSEERQRIIDSRNTLVHQGQFYCQAVAKGEVDKSWQPLDSPAAEYFFMVSMLDRIFLKLLGYAGEYIDWGTANGPTKKLLL
jgi:hypothetical protein